MTTTFSFVRMPCSDFVLSQAHGDTRERAWEGCVLTLLGSVFDLSRDPLVKDSHAYTRREKTVPKLP